MGQCRLHPLIHTSGLSECSTKYCSSVSRGRVCIKVCNPHSPNKKAEAHRPCLKYLSFKLLLTGLLTHSHPRATIRIWIASARLKRSLILICPCSPLFFVPNFGQSTFGRFPIRFWQIFTGFFHNLHHCVKRDQVSPV